MIRTTFTAAALGALAISLGGFEGAQASSLVVDRGLPNQNFNKDAGANRSNIAWAFTNAGFSEKWHSGDTFSLPATPDPSRPSWRIDKLTTWFIAGAPGVNADPLQNAFSDISLFLGADSGVGGTIDQVASSAISGDSTSAPNVSISKVTYPGTTLDYQRGNGELVQIWQADFTDLGTFSAGDYMFSVAGLPDDTLFFNHGSNAALGGVPSDGADGLYWALAGSATDPSKTIVQSFDSNGDGWDKSSDLNVQVFASPVPLPAGGILLLTALGGLGGAGALRRRRKAA